VRRAAYSAIAFLALVASARPEYMLVVLQTPVRASSLSGVIVDMTGIPIPEVTVDVVDCPIGRSYGMPLNRRLATTLTDAQGEFSFDRKGLEKLYCMHLSKVGFNPVEFQVKLSPLAGKMRVKLPIGG
jgi:hypothetical protein